MRFIKINNFSFNLDAIPYYRRTSQKFFVKDTVQPFRLTPKEDEALSNALRDYPESFLCFSSHQTDLFINKAKLIFFKEMNMMTEIRFGEGKLTDFVREPDLIAMLSNFANNVVTTDEPELSNEDQVMTTIIDSQTAEKLPNEELTPAEKRKRTLAEKKAKESEKSTE